MNFDEINEQNDKFSIDGYKEINKVQINHRLMILAEDSEIENRYMVGEYTRDNPFGIWVNEWAGVTNDYIEALSEFTKRVQHNINCITTERGLRQRMSGVEGVILTAADCLSNGLNENIEDKLIIIKADVLSAEYRRSDYQLKIATGGFGCSPTARGNAVFCKDLYSGNESRFERSDVLGVADISRLPEWAKIKTAEYEAEKSGGDIADILTKPNTKTTAEKPSLLGGLDEAKGVAAKQQSEHKGSRELKAKKTTSTPTK